MKIHTTRDQLLPPLLQVSGVVERRQTLPILANILVKAEKSGLSITATDLETELRTKVDASSDAEDEFTVPARKLLDICKALPIDAGIEIDVEGEKAVLKSGKSKFRLSLLPARDFPSVEATSIEQTFTIEQGALRRLLEKTSFAMAQQDVRYYLNGLLLEVRGSTIRAVATDGHRLALCEQTVALDGDIDVQVIVPRKTVLELVRLLGTATELVKVELSANHIRFSVGDVVFTSKLIDGRFPDYQRVIPVKTVNNLKIGREELRSSLVRASILSNEKYRGIRFKLSKDRLLLQAHNPEQEEAEEDMPVDYGDSELSIGFNVGYLLDVLGTVDSEEINFGLNDANSSALITGVEELRCQYVIMPMRL